MMNELIFVVNRVFSMPLVVAMIDVVVVDAVVFVAAVYADRINCHVLACYSFIKYLVKSCKTK